MGRVLAEGNGREKGITEPERGDSVYVLCKVLRTSKPKPTGSC